MASIANIIDDAEKLAAGLTPSGDLSKVVGVLALHVEQLAGKELDHLADDILGVAAPSAEQAAANVTEANAARVAELEAENARLRGAPAPGAGSA